MRDPLEGAVRIDDPLARAVQTDDGGFLNKALGAARWGLERVTKPLTQTASELQQLPGALYAGLKSAGDISWGEAVRKPSQIGEALKETGKGLARGLPAMAGAGIGALAGPWGIPLGAFAGEIWYRNLMNYLKGGEAPPSQSVGETLDEATKAALYGAVPLAAAKGATRLTGRGILKPDPRAIATFQEAKVPFSVGDVAASSGPLELENVFSRMIGGGPINKLEQAQVRAFTERLQETFRRAGPTLSTEETAKLARREAVGELKGRKDIYTQLRQAGLAEDPNAAISMAPAQAQAKELLEEVTRTPYKSLRPAGRERQTFKELAQTETPATEVVSPILSPQGKPIVTTIPGRSLETLSYPEFESTVRMVGQRGAHPEVIGTPMQGRYESLNKALLQGLEESQVGPQLRKAARYYAEEVSPIRKTKIGKLISGQLTELDIAKTLNPKSLADIDTLAKYAPKAFMPVRNRVLGNYFEQRGVFNPESGVNVPQYLKAWRGIPEETRIALFRQDPQVKQAFDLLADTADYLKRKPGISGTGSMPLGQFLTLAGSGGAVVQVLKGILTGEPSQIAAGAILGASVVGAPYAYAKFATRPQALRSVTPWKPSRAAGQVSGVLGQILRQEGD